VLPKKLYGIVLREIEAFRLRNFVPDRAEHPELSPPGYKSSLNSLLLRLFQVNHLGNARAYVEPTLAMLVEKGIIVSYLGDDYTFPTGAPLPTRQQVIAEARLQLKKLDQIFQPPHKRGNHEPANKRQ
jgi:hypothetical protein